MKYTSISKRFNVFERELELEEKSQIREKEKDSISKVKSLKTSIPKKKSVPKSCILYKTNSNLKFPLIAI